MQSGTAVQPLRRGIRAQPLLKLNGMRTRTPRVADLPSPRCGPFAGLRDKGPDPM